MERRLLEAAQTGNVQDLQSLMRQNPLLLWSSALIGGENPLYIACTGGHVDFVKEMKKLRPDFAGELNQDGFSPLHLASANGDVEIVRELLLVDCNLCTIRGSERRIPLHYAVIKGRIQVIRELLSACADSIAELTARGETSLHLALKNNQFEAFAFLVEYLKQSNKEDILNKKDNQGDTILHCAVSGKKYEVVDFLLDQNNLTEGRVDVNSLNKRGFTPLDVLLIEGGDREIEEILRLAGAIRAEDLHSLQQPALSHNVVVTTQNPSNDQHFRRQNTQERPESHSKQLQNYFKYNKHKDSPGEVRNTLLVLSVLIATATYQAVLSPPGGVWQDDLPGNTSNDTFHIPHKAGEAVMGSHNPTAYGLFLIFNSVGFFTSIHMINFLTLGFPLQIELQFSLLSLLVTYDTSMTAISPSSSISGFFTIISVVLPLLIPIVSKILRDNSKKVGCAFKGASRRLNQFAAWRWTVQALIS